MKILITSGATREPIDAVRFLSNVSTGTTGAALAEQFAQHGHDVSLLRGAGAVVPTSPIDVEAFSSAEDLRARLQHRLGAAKFDLVIMAAAVADYRPVTADPGKRSSEPAEITLQLVRNPKILPQLKSFSPHPLGVVGFKLTVGADETAGRTSVAQQLASGGVDAVVHNDLAEMRTARVHPFYLYTPGATQPERLAGVPALVAALLRLFDR